MSFHLLSWIYWNPPREAFFLPILDRPVMWYGIFFVLGFVFGYRIFLPLLKTRLHELMKPEQKLDEIAELFGERLTWFIVIGTLIGARLGHVVFYDWPYYQHHLIDIFKIWEGGLASHGGTLGVLLSIMIFLKFNQKLIPKLSLLGLLDLLVIPTALTAFFIRIGNFFNQEILGTETTLPWAVIFGNPIDGSVPVPRHPVQIYEALCYLLIFALLYTLWKINRQKNRPGFLCGLFFLMVFTSRLFIEFLKNPQSLLIDESLFQMGQYLSLPFIFLGCMLMYRSKGTVPSSQQINERTPR